MVQSLVGLGQEDIVLTKNAKIVISIQAIIAYTLTVIIIGYVFNKFLR
jgi:hypothetical protein